MNKRWFSIACLCLFLSNFSQNLKAVTDTVVKLNLIATIPSDTSDVYIAMTMDFTVDHNSNIWISDSQQNKIFQFGPDFNYIKSIGDLAGQGPGEFISPTFISAYRNELFVVDLPNRVQILDFKGKYITSFMKGTAGHGITNYGDGIIVPGVHMDEKTTIEAYDRTGKVIARFGELFKGTDELVPLFNLGRVHICNNKIYFSFLYYPEVQVYDTNYKLIRRIIIDSKKYEELYKDNLKFNYIKSSPNKMGKSKMLFIASYVNRQGIFFITRGKEILVDHFDFQGKQIAQYIYPNYDFAATDMHVEEMPNGDLRFYILGGEISDYIPKVKILECKH